MTKRRKRQLDNIKARQGRKLVRSLDDPEVRDEVAEAVHKAVCDHTHTDGVGQCMGYSIAGCGLLRRVFNQDCYPQAGTLQVAYNEAGEAITFDAELGFIEGFGGEFHCWVGDLKNQTIIDFSARHYKSYLNRMVVVEGELGEWTLPDPPRYLWFNTVPEGYSFKAFQGPTDHVVRHAAVHARAENLALVARAVDYYRAA